MAPIHFYAYRLMMRDYDPTFMEDVIKNAYPGDSDELQEALEDEQGYVREYGEDSRLYTEPGVPHSARIFFFNKGFVMLTVVRKLID